jgi:hypothetical protein
MKYMLMIFDPADGYDGSDGMALLERVIAAHGALAEELAQTGVLVNGAGLQEPQTAKTILRDGNGQTAVLDGPYAETKEHLGGYYLVEVEDFDAAVAIARRIPGVAGTKIEVRPVMIGD